MMQLQAIERKQPADAFKMEEHIARNHNLKEVVSSPVR